ncbi:DUF2004 domain-containing protein [Cryobacterium psychrophilum]|uniref:DUF2004 domain-containing protein n=1 Tax=Cryobacterium psychrophilum TaxID=41988 RepID=A0A4Y8KQ07_9MICO|nr:DUF2004 domain-containing protein [Cryobacterium psychrophilum]TDW31211.1 uncharacterized protein DUF2004 [Cryobacterium psychrophilum]TFD78496.1 DUF2004 domain-containing protein [Cryobacterium psychrophilum]
MTIEHDFFGILGSDDSGEVYWSETAELGDQDIEVDLSSPSEDDVAAESLDIAAAMINNIEDLDSAARESLVAELTTKATPTSTYIDQHVDEMDPEALADAIIWDSGDQQIDFLRSLRLQRVGFHPHHTGSEEHFALLEYSISPDDTDSLLIVAIDINGDTVQIAIEN